MNEENTVGRPVMWGCNDLREWLISQGFKCSVDTLMRDNGCNWYAYRRSAYPARECECNEGKAMQLVVRPFAYSDDTRRWESAEIDVTGEVHGLWFKLSAYSVSPDELKARLQEIEIRLLDSWNALAPHKTFEVRPFAWAMRIPGCDGSADWVEIGQDMPEPFPPAVATPLYDQAAIDAAAAAEREACARLMSDASLEALAISHERFARYSAECADMIRARSDA